uniref:Signal recognition particle subunit SRP72 n=1 Tax=Schistocephalus solidus TaxID=70667 RepID=A0A0X3Q2Y2_SCHSO
MTHQQDESQLIALHGDLEKACRSLSYSKILSFADKVLALFPGDDYANRCKAVALVHLERFEDCLNFIRKKKLSECVMVKAYSEYRLNRLDDALKTIKNSGLENPGILELQAQILYRQEDFENSYDCYKSLTKTFKDDYEDERFTNMLATIAALSETQQKTWSPEYKPALFETDFNVACYHVGRKDYSKALKLLKKAEDLCLDSFKDDPNATEDQINQETAPIRVQRAFVLQCQKKESEAAEIYHTIIRQKSGDPSLMAVAANNLICINREQNVFDTKKRMKAISLESLKHKLFRFQRTAMLFNQGLFYLQAGQLDACRAKVKAVLEEDPNCVPGLLLHAAYLTRIKQLAQAIKILEAYCRSPAYCESSVFSNREGLLRVPLYLLHLYLLRLNPKTATGTTEASPPLPQGTILTLADALSLCDQLRQRLLPEAQHLLHAPALVSLRVALSLQALRKSGGAGDSAGEATSAAKAIIIDALSGDGTDGARTKPENLQFLDQCTSFFLRYGFAEEAASLLEQRMQQLAKASDPAALQKRQNLLALLIQAYSKFDHAKAEAASRDLEFKEKLSEKEVDSLENSFLIGVKSVKKAGRVAVAAAAAAGGTPKAVVAAAKETPVQKTPGSGSKKAQQKKKRKVRLPKNFDPNIPPDPERWLPRRERTGYRGKRRDKRGANLLRGPQGQTAAAPELDMGNTSPRDAPATSSPLADASSSGGQTANRRPQPSAKSNQKRGHKKKR